MSGIYISTSRKPSQRTRRLARWLEKLLGGESENRGKRSIREIVSRAEEKGLGMVLLIYERHGNPAELCFLADAHWLACVIIKSLKREERSILRLPRGKRSISGTGSMGKKLAGILSAELSDSMDSGERTPLSIACTDSEISFSLGGKPVGPLIEIAGMRRMTGIEEE